MRDSLDLQTGRIVAVIVTYNRREILAKTLARVLEEPVDRVLVVDNGSTDGTRDLLNEENDPRLRVINSPVNTGGAGGFEVGMRVAMAEEAPDWLLIMDDDARPQPGAVSHFRQNTPLDADAVAAGTYLPDGQICEMNRPSRNPFWHLPSFLKTLAGGGRNGFHVGDAVYDTPGHVDIDASSFVGLFLSNKAVERNGFPDGRLFIYGDDVLYTLGLRRKGMRLVFMPSVAFEHDCRAVVGWGGDGAAKRYTPLWKAYYNYRNGVFTYREAAGALLFWPVLMVASLKWLRNARAYGPDRAKYLKLLRIAVVDGVMGRRHRPHSEVMQLASSSSE
jgi:GT2 family glycosyltransferase